MPSALPTGADEASTAPPWTNRSSRVHPSLPGPRRRPPRPLRTNRMSRFRPSLSGPRRRPPNPLETKRSSRVRPCLPRPSRRLLRPFETNSSYRFRSPLPGSRRRLLRPIEANVLSSSLPVGAEEVNTATPWDEYFVPASQSPSSLAVGTCFLRSCGSPSRTISCFSAVLRSRTS